MAVHGSALAKNGGMRPWATVAYSRWLLEQAAAEESDAELNFVEAELLRLFLHLFFLRRPKMGKRDKNGDFFPGGFASSLALRWFSSR